MLQYLLAHFSGISGTCICSLGNQSIIVSNSKHDSSQYKPTPTPNTIPGNPQVLNTESG